MSCGRLIPRGDGDLGTRPLSARALCTACLLDPVTMRERIKRSGVLDPENVDAFVADVRLAIVSDSPINIPPYYDSPKDVLEVWRLQKGAHVVTCHLWTHPMGGEARIEADGEWMRDEGSRNGLVLVEMALDWKAQFQERGWV